MTTSTQAGSRASRAIAFNPTMQLVEKLNATRSLGQRVALTYNNTRYEFCSITTASLFMSMQHPSMKSISKSSLHAKITKNRDLWEAGQPLKLNEMYSITSREHNCH